MFEFFPSGVILACALNAPGSMSESQIEEWGAVYEKQAKLYEKTGGCCDLDSAISKGENPFICKSTEDNLSVSENSEEMVTKRQAT